MPSFEMYHQLIVHIVWTTRDRVPSIGHDRAVRLAEELPVVAGYERCRMLALGIVSTHVHLLLAIHPSTQLPRLLQRLKGRTARTINGGTASNAHHLRWAKGYSITSVSPRALPIALDYVRNQNRRHPDLVIPGWGARD